MYLRETYLGKIRPLIGQPLIKALTGIRGSGKSSLMKMVRQQLLSAAVPEDNIIYLDLEQALALDISSGLRLLSYIQYRKTRPGIHFILLDEIQQVDGWTEAVRELATDLSCDVYLADSAGESLMKTLESILPDRSVEIPVLPLSLGEFCDLAEESEPGTPFEQLAERYIRQGGLPILTAVDDDDSRREMALGLYRSILLSDVVLPGKIRDVALLFRIMRYVLLHVGQVFSVKSIYDDLKLRQQRASAETIANHLKALEGSGLLFRVPRYDLKTQAILHSNVKYYLADHHLLRVASGQGNRNLAGIWQNMIFLELTRRSYRVCCAKTGRDLIDFAAEKDGRQLLIQIPERRRSEQSLVVAAKKLQSAGPSLNKLIVLPDQPRQFSAEGIPCMALSDFLIQSDWPSGQ